MTSTILDKILAVKRETIERQKAAMDLTALKERAFAKRKLSTAHRLRPALERTDRNNVIAEIKRASPSKGVINADIAVAEIARKYEQGGAAAISVLTEEDFFNGSLDDLNKAKNAVGLPILRKDFIIDEIQVFESAAAGADAILLIVAALETSELAKFLKLGRDTLEMDVIVEVHDEDELRIADSIGADIIGVNNRDLHSFEVSLDISRRLIRNRAATSLMIAESGISTRRAVEDLRLCGFHGFLIGESLVRSGHPADKVRDLAVVQDSAVRSN